MRLLVFTGKVSDEMAFRHGAGGGELDRPADVWLDAMLYSSQCIEAGQKKAPPAVAGRCEGLALGLGRSLRGDSGDGGIGWRLSHDEHQFVQVCDAGSHGSCIWGQVVRGRGRMVGFIEDFAEVFLEAFPDGGEEGVIGDAIIAQVLAHWSFLWLGASVFN